MTDQEREFYLSKRQTLIMELGAIEDLLGMERSIVPKRKREYRIGSITIEGDDLVEMERNLRKGALRSSGESNVFK